MADRLSPFTSDAALTHVTVAAVVGIAAGLVAAAVGPGPLAPLIGWDAAAVVYLAWTWVKVGRLEPAETASHAQRLDPTRAGTDLLLLVASAASLVAVGVVIVRAGQADGAAKLAQAALGTGSVVLSWLVVHLTYMLRYARIYHDDTDGGVDFNQDEPPRYTDFAYLSFTIGMTFQVSDTSLTSSQMRRTALRHALLSYLYGTVIIATAINMVAGISR